VEGIFEAWVNRCHSPHTCRAYRADLMSFVEFMEIAWPEAATGMLKVPIADVLDFRGYMLDLGMAPNFSWNFYLHIRASAALSSSASSLKPLARAMSPAVPPELG
jgi:hypothetical protein